MNRMTHGRHISVVCIALCFFVMSMHGQDIHEAVRMGDEKKVETLLQDHPEYVNATDDRGRTPLFFASMSGDDGIVRLLIAKGADVHAKDAYGDSPLYHATVCGHKEIVHILAHHGADIDEVMQEGTPLSLAIYSGHLEIAKQLIKLGADVSLRMKDDKTVLHHAAEKGDRASVEIVVGAGADVNARTPYDVTPLHIAAVYGHREAVEALIDNGANLDANSAFAGTPLHQAEAAGNDEIVRLLLARGAKKSTRPFLNLAGDYLGMKKPGETPEPFAQGIIDPVHRWIRSPSFSSDGKEVYWSAGAPQGVDERIWFMRRENGRWQPPRIAPFSSEYDDANPHLSADGRTIFFCSNRPVEKNGQIKKDRDIWMVKRKGESDWGVPINVDSPVNTDKPEPSLSVSRNGTLYFHANRYEDSRGSGDIYRSRFINGRYIRSENLGDAINTPYPESQPCIAPDESYLVFQSVRPENISPGFNLYVSFRSANDTWTEARNLGTGINFDEASVPKISPDGIYLFFKRAGKIFWVDAKIIEDLKPKKIK